MQDQNQKQAQRLRPLVLALVLAALALPLALLPEGRALAQAGEGANASGEAVVTDKAPEIAAEAPPLSPAEHGGSEPGTTASPEWMRLADRAERVLEAGRASDGTLEQLRSELAEWRSRFQDSQSQNASRIEAVKSQIAALGPGSSEGSIEAPELALRRTELEAQLSRLDAPRRAAEEAYSRADALIRQIDALLRERKASELLRLGPTPLNPVYWPTAAREVTATLGSLMRETAVAWSSDERRATLRNRLPVILGMVVLALLVLRRLPILLGLAARRLSAGKSVEFARAVDFVKSGLRLLGVIGAIWMLKQAMLRADMFGYRGALLIENLWNLGLVLAASAWLGGRIFPRGEPQGSFFNLAAPRMAEARFLTIAMGVCVWALWLAQSLTQLEGWSDTTRAILQFPVLVVAGLGLLRLGQLISSRPKQEDQAGSGQAEFRNGLTYTVGRAVSVLGVLGPVLGAVGYMAAANYLTVPTAETLALIGLLVLFQGFFTNVYGVVTGRQGQNLEAALGPVLAGVVMTMASLPLMALIWGARVADLSEIWVKLRDGFSLGGTRISAGMFLSFLVVFLVGYGLTKLVQGTLRSTVLPKTSIDPGGQTALVSGVGYLGIVLAALFAITSAGMDLSSLAVLFGALSVGIGFGLQNIVQNFVSGIIMLVERPVAVGDWIEVGGNQGIVKEIAVRSTRIETFDKTSVIVPNANFISGVVTNWTRGSLNGRITVPITVSYGSDTRRVEAILREIVEAHPLVMLTPKPSVTLENFSPSGIEFAVRAILANINFGGSVRSELRHTIINRFIQEKINMPGFPVPAPLATLDKLAQALIPVAASGGPRGAGQALAEAAAEVDAAARAVERSAEGAAERPAEGEAEAAAKTEAAGKDKAQEMPRPDAAKPAAPLPRQPGYGPPDDTDDDDDTPR